MAWPAYRAWQAWAASRLFAGKDVDEVLAPSPKHVEAIRSLHFTWEPFWESGMPMVEPRAPYGSRSPIDDLAPILGTRDRVAVARFHLEVGRGFLWALEHGELEPGRYVLGGLTNASMAATLRNRMKGLPEGKVEDALKDLPRLEPDGTFLFTEEHRKLLRHLRFQWSDASPVDLPVLMVNPKRPFGDMSAFNIDMAAILGWPPLSEQERREFDPRLWKLYLEMWPALRTFAEHAKID
jgi:hypothetical protein